MAFEDSTAEFLTPQEEETLHALLNDLPVGEPPADLTARIMGAVAAEDARSKLTVVKKKPTFRWKSLASLAAVLALAFVGTWSLSSRDQVAAPAPSTAQEEAGLAPFSMDGRSARAVNTEDDIETASLKPETQNIGEEEQPVTGFSLRTDSISTPQEALECLARDRFEDGTSYTLTAENSDTEEIAYRIRVTDGKRTLSEGIVTYLETTDSGFRFEWDEGDGFPQLFTVTPDGAILTTTVTAPMNPSAPQD